MKNIKNCFVIIFLLVIFSCNYNITTVEMYEQQKGLLLKLKYRIETTMGSMELKFKKKQFIDLQGQIVSIGSYFTETYGSEYYTLRETCYYNSTEKIIKVYFYLSKNGLKTIDNLDTILFVEPFEKFNGFYTEYFIFEDVLYQAVSIKSEIHIGELVDEFDYDRIKESKIAQYKIWGTYGEEERLMEKELNDRGGFSFRINYIFPEEFNEKYVRLSIF